MKNILLLFFLSCFINGFTQQRNVKITPIKVTEQLYMLKGQGGNIGLFIGDDAVFMIDDQFAPLTPKILETIKTITKNPVNYLINTHWHGDHTGGNENMGKEGALIIAHNNVRKRLSSESIRRGKKLPPAPKIALPVITFENDLVFHINKDDVLATHVHKAHTDGDVVIYFTNNNVLHTGDAYFHKRFPYIDLSSGGSIKGYIEGIKKMLFLIDKDTKIIPGHGDISNKSEMKNYLAMLTTLSNRVDKAIKEGKSLEEVKSDESITKGFETYDGWITKERIRTTIYKSLTQ